jgi:hypothetical protein
VSRRRAVSAWARRLTLGQALEALGLRRGATLAEAKAAYRARVKEVHPDRNPSPDAAEQYQILTEAHARAAAELADDSSRSSSSRSRNGSIGLTNFAVSLMGFAHSVMTEVAVPLARDVAAPLARSVMNHTRNAAAAAAAQGQLWQETTMGGGAVDKAELISAAEKTELKGKLEAGLAATETGLAAAIEELRIFDVEESAQVQVRTAHDAAAASEATAAAATAVAATTAAAASEASAQENVRLATARVDAANASAEQVKRSMRAASGARARECACAVGSFFSLLASSRSCFFFFSFRRPFIANAKTA